MTAESDSLGEQVGAALGALDSFRLAYEKQEKRRNRAVVVALVVAFVAIGIAFAARQDLHQSVSHTAQQRIAACVQYNIQQRAQVAAEEKEIRQLTNQAQPGTEARIASFLAGYDKTVEKAHVPRDCTPAGIAAYLALPPTTKG